MVLTLKPGWEEKSLSVSYKIFDLIGGVQHFNCLKDMIMKLIFFLLVSLVLYFVSGHAINELHED